ncbi:alpha/beta hydrolase [Limibacter armeniacum]|uniref:alpha/beta fold hydrolase n=1 Tax=Limibacter armeniacum TaxID=466084 RepID=UPI002FE6C218
MCVHNNQTIEVNGTLIRFQHLKQNTDPAAPTLVFLHEGLGCIEFWKDVPSLLAQETGLNILSYDRQGHGQSDPLSSPRTVEYLHHEAQLVLPLLLEKLGISRPILIGHSDGGSIALLYAAHHPTRAIVTEAAHIFVEEVTLEGIKHAVAAYPKIKDKLYKYHGEKTDTLFYAWADTWLTPEFIGWNIEKEVNNIQCPSLIIQGIDDEYATQEQVTKIVSLIGESAISVMIENCGHTPHIQAKEATLKQMLTFIRKVL